VIADLQRSRDMRWFWCILFSLDMMQVAPITDQTGG
jgi:hypothetical protein